MHKHKIETHEWDKQLILNRGSINCPIDHLSLFQRIMNISIDQVIRWRLTIANMRYNSLPWTRFSIISAVTSRPPSTDMHHFSLSNFNRLHIDPIFPKLTEWERERHLFDFQKTLRGVGAEKEKYNRATKFEWNGSRWSSFEDIQHQGTQVYRLWYPVNCEIQTRGTMSNGAGAEDLDNQGERVQQVSQYKPIVVNATRDL